MERDERLKPVGIFDSGLGGLTVLKALIEALPGEDTVYLGDTARVPYGTKSPETVVRYSLQNAAFLTGKGIKLLVVACNTASATSLEALAARLPLPVVGVIEPGAEAAVRQTRNGTVGVIGTRATIQSGAYERALTRRFPSVRVVSRPCPLFVSLAEEGWTENDVAERTARHYLEPLTAQGIDTLLLGCTHYPLLARTIARCVGGEVALIDSARETAAAVARLLEERGLAHPGERRGSRSYYVTDLPSHFWEVGRRFLGDELDNVSLVDLKEEPTPTRREGA
jgi:glutamate racemase